MTQATPPNPLTKLNKSSSNSFPFQRILPIFWLCMVMGLLMSSVMIFHRGIQIETNLMSLLPSLEQEVFLEKSVEIFYEKVSQNLFFLIGHKDEVYARKSALDLADSLRQSGLFNSVQAKVNTHTWKAWYDFYFPYRYQIISAEIRNLLNQSEAPQVLLLRLQQKLFSPLPLYSSRLLSEDPLLLFPSFLQSLPQPPGKLEVIDGMLTVREGEMSYILVNVTLRHEPLNISQQPQVINHINDAIDEIESVSSGTKILYTGFLRFATAGALRAQKEVTTIGFGSLIGILILMTLTFRGFRQIILVLLPIFVGILSAFTVCSFLFPKLHLLTFVFGASLIGVSIDYAFHYFVKHRLANDSWNAWAGLRAIFPAITMGVITSILGYAGFYLTPFQGLQQIAVFSSVGLLGAFGTVVCWFPLLLRKPSNFVSPPITMLPAKWFLCFWDKPSHHPTILLGLVLAGVGCVLSFWAVQYDDDIRALEHLSPKLKKEDKNIHDLIGGLDVSHFIVVRGVTEEELLQRQENATKRLQAFAATNDRFYYQSLATFLPSAKTQSENFLLSRGIFLDESQTIQQGLTALGFEAESGKRLFRNVANPKLSFTVKQWLESPVSKPLRHLWLGQIGQDHVSLILLGREHNPEVLAPLFEEMSGVEYVNQVERISALFTVYREETEGIITLAYGVIFIFLLCKYHIRRALQILAPPALATLLTFAILSLTGQNLNFFHIVSSLLILGIGVDYTIFFAESKHSVEETALVILLSAITTLLSFGLLFLSQTPALASVGITITLGIGFTMLLSPLACCFEQNNLNDI